MYVILIKKKRCKLRATERLVEKFDLCYAIPEIKISKDRATLRGKFEKLIDAKVLLCSGFLVTFSPLLKHLA